MNISLHKSTITNELSRKFGKDNPSNTGDYPVSKLYCIETKIPSKRLK
ncbi:MAG: hypothetical protein M3162_04190 [Thermoproteota archaeon]|nr:hypothetical protein [Thermoproteota archaeon]